MTDPTKQSVTEANSLKKQQVLQNGIALASVVETIRFAGIKNIALIGQRDDGRFNPTGFYPQNNGIFRTFLRFHVNSSVLQKRLLEAAVNALHTSKRTKRDTPHFGWHGA